MGYGVGTFGINRNIVECKEVILNLVNSFNHCINRNIVECKESKRNGIWCRNIRY